jgi:hypothetical protein
MTRRTKLSLLYSGATSTRWVRAAIDTAVGDLSGLCRWQWQNASIITVRVASEPKGSRSR